jgi:hypothetical protein
MAYDPLDAFFLTEAQGGLAKVATLINTAGVSKSVNVIFDRENTLSSVGGVVVQSARPQCVIKTTDLPGAETETKATIAIAGVTYKIVDPQADADGTTTLILTLD